jgi:DNA-binding transcriptional LysR family regulator
VHDRRLDVAVLYLPINEPDLVHRRLASEDLLLALPEAHPAASEPTIALTDVADEPFVLPERHDVPGLHAAITALFADAGVTPRIAQRGVWLIQTVLGLVAAGIGLAVVPSSAVTLGRKGIALRRLSDGTQRLDLAAIWRPDSTSTPLKGLVRVMGR